MSQSPRPNLRLGDVLRRAKWLLLAALILRVVLAVTVYPNPIAGEVAAFEQLGRWLADGRGFINDIGMPTAYHPLGYPLLIAGLYQLAGEQLVVVRIVQAFLSTLSLLILGTFAVRAGGIRAMWKVLIVGAILPADLFHVTSLLPTTFATLLLYLLLLLLAPWLDERRDDALTKLRVARAALAGLLGGVLALVQPVLLFLPLLLWGWVFWRSRARKLVLRVALLSLLLSAIGPAAWIVRNDIAVGERTLTTGTGAAFYLGNHPFAPGGDPWYDIPYSRPPFERATQRMLIRSTFDSMVRHPFATLKRITRKWSWTLRSDQGLVARQVVGYEQKETVDALRATPLLLRLFTWFVHVAVFAAGWSAWWFGPRGPWRTWTALLFLYIMASVTLFYGAPAQHAYLFPPMLLAAVMLPERHEDFAQPTIPAGICWMIGFLFGVGVWLVEAVQLISL